MPSNAPYTGGYSPGAQLCAVDGDFTSPDPSGPPRISFPFQRDSILSTRDIFVWNNALQEYVTCALNVFPNIQPWSPAQQTFVIEQDFVVAQAAFIPLPMNYGYNQAWALGWVGETFTGLQLPALGNAILVEQGPFEDIGAGLVRYTLKFATIPPTRNTIEQFIYTYPAYADQATSIERSQISIPTFSRLQFDYYVFDDLNILSTPLFPVGNRLNAATGINPNYFLLQQQYYFQSAADVGINAFQTAGDLNDGGSGTPATVPGFTQYTWLVDGTLTSNNLPGEIIAEGSTISPWMGNIWERRTRFVVAL